MVLKRFDCGVHKFKLRLFNVLLILESASGLSLVSANHFSIASGNVDRLDSFSKVGAKLVRVSILSEYGVNLSKSIYECHSSELA